MNQAEATAKLYEVSFSRFGKPVIYTPVGGEPKETLAIPRFGEAPGERSPRGGQAAQEHLAQVLVRADATLGIPSPTRRDLVTLMAPSGEQETWLVDKVVEGDGAAWKLDLIRDRRPVPAR